MDYLMQAASSVDGALYTWTAASPDWAASGYPGDGTATDVAVAAAAPAGGGGTSPGGSDTQVQFNDGGSFGGDAGLTYDKATDVLSVVGGVVLGASGHLSVGATPAASGAVRLENASPISARNAGDSADIALLELNSSNEVVIAPGGGPVTFAGTDANNTGLSLCTEKLRGGQVQTSSTSETTVYAFTMSDETLVAFDFVVTCARRTNVTKGGRYKRSVVYRRTGGGAPTIVGTLESGTDQETTAGDDVTVDVSGNDVRVRVTAADADGRNWTCFARIQEGLST